MEPTRPTEELQIRVHDAANRPTLVYLPGLHGDWTLAGSFRRALGGQLRFVEITYPRSLTWSLDDYAAAIESALTARNLKVGWLLGESFGSQIVWALAARKRFQTKGIILAGGFVRHPLPPVVRVAQTITAATPFRIMRAVTRLYGRLLRVRYRRSPEVLASLVEFIARRTDLDRHAAAHRLGLLWANDPSAQAREVRVPVFGMSGWFDPVVPWRAVRRWLRANCSSLRDFRVILHADHVVLGTAPDRAAKLVLGWIYGAEQAETRPETTAGSALRQT